MLYTYDKKRTEKVEGITSVLYPYDTRVLDKQTSLKIMEYR